MLPRPERPSEITGAAKNNKELGHHAIILLNKHHNQGFCTVCTFAKCYFMKNKPYTIHIFVKSILGFSLLIKNCTFCYLEIKSQELIEFCNPTRIAEKKI